MKLAEKFGKGFSEDTLKNCRKGNILLQTISNGLSLNCCMTGIDFTLFTAYAIMIVINN